MLMKEPNKFIDLSYCEYNRRTHDKFMHADVSEINFIVGLDDMVNQEKDKDRICKFIVNDCMDELVDNELLHDIRIMQEEDFIYTCSWTGFEDNYTWEGPIFNISFLAGDYYILRHIKDYHVYEFLKDLKNGSIDKVLRLEVGTDRIKGEKNLIVKVYPSKSTYNNNTVSYTISLLYLVLFFLYKKFHKEDISNEVIRRVFLYIRPIITKVVYTVTTKADDSYTWFLQLKQLESGYKFFTITKDTNQVKFLFRPKQQCLRCTLDVPVVNFAPSESNYSARLVESTYSIGKDNVLTCKTTIISKDMVDSIFTTLKIYKVNIVLLQQLINLVLHKVQYLL